MRHSRSEIIPATPTSPDAGQKVAGEEVRELKGERGTLLHHDNNFPRQLSQPLTPTLPPAATRKSLHRRGNRGGLPAPATTTTTTTTTTTATRRPAIKELHETVETIPRRHKPVICSMRQARLH
ncbi:hypothetical protein E2C01_100328 [Portunus trituberculatus]|uniref:Uncharacterized protein n=1 Tax=Portunus trituberculatus TaxID=210409 RepID=A0A5B7KBS1_PORTR|nr:hypothetical protein [Portunus trituberculatus]